jgi:dephospho-CoA kinase
MITVGLTGPTGAGKGVFSKILEKHGIPCLDTDIVSRRVCEAGMPCTTELAESFGNDILKADGSLDRKKLADKVFSEDTTGEKAKLLNKITHKYILDEIYKWQNIQEESHVPCCVIDAPLLFEAGLDKNCEYIIAVLADTETRIKRITARDGISREQAQKRISAQKNDDFFKANCNVVFLNDGNETELEASALPYINKLKNGELPN